MGDQVQSSGLQIPVLHNTPCTLVRLSPYMSRSRHRQPSSLSPNPYLHDAVLNVVTL